MSLNVPLLYSSCPISYTDKGQLTCYRKWKVQATFDGIDVDKYLRDNDNGVEQNDETERELERIAL